MPTKEDRLKGLTTAVALALLLPDCRTSQKTRVAGGVEGGIGDDVCAVMLSIDASVVDIDGRPVGETELWEQNRIQPGKAYRLGATDPDGRLSVRDCYMPSFEFRLWHPTAEPLRLRFMVVREGFGVERLDVTFSADELLATGNLLGVRPGYFFDWSEVKVDPAARDRSYRVPLRVTLRRIQQ